MKKLFLLLITFALAALTRAQTNFVPPMPTPGRTVETIVCLRHGEKPPGGLGQLTCRGLNRALALPDVLLRKFGAPQFIFAPNPSHKLDGVPGYYYIRPLMTIEPTAIRCDLPVNVEYAYNDLQPLAKEFMLPKYQNATLFVAWEHVELDAFAKNFLRDNGVDARAVPSWPGKEYDMIFIFKIIRDHGQKQVTFSVDYEGLNGLSDHCPGPAK